MHAIQDRPPDTTNFWNKGNCSFRNINLKTGKPIMDDKSVIGIATINEEKNIGINSIKLSKENSAITAATRKKAKK